MAMACRDRTAWTSELLGKGVTRFHFLSETKKNDYDAEPAAEGAAPAETATQHHLPTATSEVPLSFQIRELRSGRTGIRVWPSALQLLQHVAAAPQIFEPHQSRRSPGRVLELGSGVGVVAVGLAKLGYDVTATDHDNLTLKNLRFNIAQNGLKLNARMRARKLDWVSVQKQRGRVLRYERLTQKIMAGACSRIGGTTEVDASEQRAVWALADMKTFFDTNFPCEADHANAVTAQKMFTGGDSDVFDGIHDVAPPVNSVEQRQLEAHPKTGAGSSPPLERVDLDGRTTTTGTSSSSSTPSDCSESALHGAADHHDDDFLTPNWMRDDVSTASSDGPADEVAACPDVDSTAADDESIQKFVHHVADTFLRHFFAFYHAQVQMITVATNVQHPQAQPDRVGVGKLANLLSKAALLDDSSSSEKENYGFLSAAGAEETGFDLVVGSDLLYEDTCGPLRATIATILRAKPNMPMLFMFQERTEGRVAKFVETLRELDPDVESSQLGYRPHVAAPEGSCSSALTMPATTSTAATSTSTGGSRLHSSFVRLREADDKCWLIEINAKAKER